MENNKYLSAKYTVIELANFSNKTAIQSFRGAVTLHLFTNEIVCFKWLLTNQLSRDCVSRHFLWPILLSCLPMMKIRAIYIYCTVYIYSIYGCQLSHWTYYSHLAAVSHLIMAMFKPFYNHKTIAHTPSHLLLSHILLGGPRR